MGDSDEEYDQRRRDKFRSERSDYSGRGPPGPVPDDRRRPDWQDRWGSSNCMQFFNLSKFPIFTHPSKKFTLYNFPGDRLCLPRVEVVGTIRQAGGIRDLGVVPDITSVQAMEAHEIAVTHLRDTVVAIAGATIVTAGGTTVRTDGAADMINPNQNDRVESESMSSTQTWMIELFFIWKEEEQGKQIGSIQTLRKE